MATRGENCNDWPRTVMTGGCSLVAFAPDGATSNDDDDDDDDDATGSFSVSAGANSSLGFRVRVASFSVSARANSLVNAIRFKHFLSVF